MATSAGSALSLIKAVLEIVADRGTGLLDVRSDGLPTRIYFAEGKPVFAEDDALGESFGRLLTRKGVISNDAFVRVIDEMTRAAAGNNQLRFGEVAVGLGVLTPDQVERGLAEQVCTIITRTLQRAESTWTFEPSLPAAKPPRVFSLEINPSVLMALREPGARSQVVAKVAELVAARPEELVTVGGLAGGPAPSAEGRDPGSGATPEMHAARIGAEQAFQKGMALLREGKTGSAAAELGRATELQPESLEYLLYSTWAKARRYREIPSESDRETLLEIAQRAKRRDPMFAFGSYVIGQVAMWNGDDATAKKWFYEALRLDPSSEAGAQVRILARRGSRTAALAGPETPAEKPAPAPAEGPAPAPVEVPQQPVSSAAAGEQPARAPAGAKGGGRLVTGMALLAAGVLVVVFVTRKTPPTVELPPAPVMPIAAPIDAAAPVAAEPAVAPEAPAKKETKAAAETATEKNDDDPQMGTVVLPARAVGHRIFVDGRRAKTEETSDGIEPLHLRCGSHVIQIGSGGTPETIELPCRGEVQIQ